MNKQLLTLLLPLLALLLGSCEDRVTYADLLDTENKSVNAYLAQYPMVLDLPSDTSQFITRNKIMEEKGWTWSDSNLKAATDLTPFYRMDNEGQVYMQILSNPGNPKAKENQEVFFRFTRYNINVWANSGSLIGAGNEADLGSTPTSLRYKNTNLTSTTQWGTGIQVPLDYLGLDCEVNLVVKSVQGPTQELSAVYPYIYHIHYYKSQI